MSTLSTYSFVPWLRQGIGNLITTGDGDTSVMLRPHIEVKLPLTGTKIAGPGTEPGEVKKDVDLYGPGDIIGIDTRAIVRTEPRAGVTNFEPNYLAHIEFYDEDFLWRYTPAAPDGGVRLRPWLTLVVLKEGEFTEPPMAKGQPLAAIDVTNLGALPIPAQLSWWAHVHVNRDLGANDAEFVSTDSMAVTTRLAAVLRENPDLGYSRLVCSRRLAADTAYTAFVIPTFEVGRLAGLGLDLDPPTVPASRSAWGTTTPGPQPSQFPVYFRWSFRTGASGDFETLVRLLRPEPVDRRVGTREMDVLFPHPGVSGLTNPALDGYLMLGGALRPPALVPPAEKTVHEAWEDQPPVFPFPQQVQEDIAEQVNWADDYRRAGVADPVITPPLYGRWHAMVSRILRDEDGDLVDPRIGWVEALNRDPRFRVAAGLGTRVVQDQQERYMDAAWDQIGAVLEAQRRIRLGQLGLQVSRRWFDRHVQPALLSSPDRGLTLAAPLGKRVMLDATTVWFAQKQTRVRPALTSAPLRRIVRPRGRLVHALPFDAAQPPGRLLEQVNENQATAAPPVTVPPGVVTPGEYAAAQTPDLPPWLIDWLRRTPAAPVIALAIGLVLAVLLLLLALVAVPALFVLLAALAAVGGLAAFVLLRRWQRRLAAAAGAQEDAQTPEAVDAMPSAGGFEVVGAGQPVTITSAPDSPEATRLKDALRDTYRLQAAAEEAGVTPERGKLGLENAVTAYEKGLTPDSTIPKRVQSLISLPPHVVAETPKGFVEPMAYPVIDEPMYEPLSKLGSELFLPNINLIGVNTVTLLETNQEFIESYLVGVNHEFARELLWREYPTDQRGTPFRQFWDVRGSLDVAGGSADEQRERLRDIPPLHEWPTDSGLGKHDNRELGMVQEDELILVIRGELLKRYPTAVVYAHRARWQRRPEPDGPIDQSQERRFIPIPAAVAAKPPRDLLQTPLYEAKIEPDIYLFGFDLTSKQAKGGDGSDPDDAGWFFVIKERPGEPRLGLDTDKQPVLQTWNDLSWPDFPAVPEDAHLDIQAAPASFPLSAPTGADSEKAEQHADDVKVSWAHDMSSGHLAYILFQAPVLVGVHASEMLPRNA